MLQKNSWVHEGMDSASHIWIPVLIIQITFTIGLTGHLGLLPGIKWTHATGKALPEEQTSLVTFVRVLNED